MKNKKISEKIEDLKEMVDWFYGEEFELDLALEKYQQAIELAKKIEEDLAKLKNEIKVLEEDFQKN